MNKIAPPRMDDYGRIQIASKASGASKVNQAAQAADTGGMDSQGSAWTVWGAEEARSPGGLGGMDTTEHTRARAQARRKQARGRELWKDGMCGTSGKGRMSTVVFD
ncbi:hypothetical protein A1Q2_06493 [Trichosporon asahii var. asahii CBS 8904]|uniref:Uncharacterized protein n=1 Tax=Trichosporon asahii var. asahii (strain CBS 8904) TaxID=1220162 RepID=K1WCE2_TRIAC|nr:hypothetical protein A1Q2_06493 [Trichosporon asahii var. asahii CBS 8904]